MRADLPAGEWREGDSALTLLPFKNQLAVLTLTGAEVRALLTETITATLPASAHAGKFPMSATCVTPSRRPTQAKRAP